MESRNPEIAEQFKRSFDFKNFESLVKIDHILNQLKQEVVCENAYLSATKTSLEIINELNKLKQVLKTIDATGKENNYNAKWMLTGRMELFKIFSSIDLLEYNIDTVLKELEKHPVEKTEPILDSLSIICNQNLLIKKLTYPLKIRLGILNHYNEIEHEVLGSVYGEIIYCRNKLDELVEKKKLLNIPDEIKRLTLEAFLQKKNENMIIHPKLISNSFILLSTADSQIYSSYTELYDSLLPIAESLKLIPLTLEDFFNTSKAYYKNLVSNCIAKYEEIMKLYRTYTTELRKFKTEYILERNDLICGIVFNEIDIRTEQTLEILENIVSIIKPIDTQYGLSGKYIALLKDVEYKLNCVALKENIFKTPLPKAKSTPSFKRNFSNPLTESLNMKPVLSESTTRNNSTEIKIFQTPRLAEEGVFSKENNAIVEKIKLELKSATKEKIIPSDSPTNDQSFSSISSSPETMRVKNIFDSPDPFVTPNSQNIQRSRLPVSTPLTTPRATPTKKYVMLPIDEEPGIFSSWSARDIPNQKPLLRYELSTVIKTENDSEEDVSNDTLGYSSSLETYRRSHNGKTYSPNSNSPPAVSRIPLPVRLESRLNLLRSASRLDVGRGKQTPTIQRSDSRLENIASTMSSKLGTKSPALSGLSRIRFETVLKTRSSSVMTQREMQPRAKEVQLGRLQQRSFGLNIIKARGSTALGTRSGLPKSRITSV